MLRGSQLGMTIEPLTPDRRRQQTREHLLSAAAQVFAERGFHGATLDAVAAAAGFSKGAVYSNFKSKEDLFLSLLESSYAGDGVDPETLEASAVPPEAHFGDFVALIRDQTRSGGDTWDRLYLEFCLYATRHPAAREQLTNLEDENVRRVAEDAGGGMEAIRPRPRPRPSGWRGSSSSSSTASGCSAPCNPMLPMMRSSRRRSP